MGRPTGTGLEAMPPAIAGPPLAGQEPNLAAPVAGVTSEAPPPAPGTSLAESLLASLAPVRVPKPAVVPGPRRVGLQAGHWLTQQVPDELRRLEHSTGASWGRITETQLNLDIANRVAARVREHGYVVDILPTTIPKAYLADAFVSLHADGDLDGSGRGFKAAHGSRRGPYEDQLVRVLSEEYGRVTGLPVDSRVSRNMLGYYAFSWSRFEATVAPHTPAAILEMGFLTNRTDRELLLGDPDRVATGVANGLLRFLHEVPAGAAFAEDLIVTPLRPRPTPATS